MSGAVVAILFDGPRLVAAELAVGRGAVIVHRWAVDRAAEGSDLSDAAAVGARLRGLLDGAGIRSRLAVVALPRSDVVLKRLTVPAGAGASDLPGLVRIQLSRKIAVSMESPVVDFVPVPADAGGVVAAALPGPRFELVRSAVAAAGLKLARVGLRADGAAAGWGPDDRPVVIAVPGPTTSEIVVARGGRPVFAHGVDAGCAPGSNADEAAFAERLGVEARRALMGQRAADEADPVAVWSSLPAVSAACERALNLPRAEATPALAIDDRAGVPSWARPTIEALAGVAGQGPVGRLQRGSGLEPGFDFAHPRAAPDRFARPRQAVLAAVLAGVLVIGSVVLWRSIELARLRGELASAREDRDTLDAALADALVTDAAAQHVERFRAAGVDWVSHLAAITGALPDASRGLVDSISGSSRGTAVTFAAKDKSDRRYSSGRWGEIISVRLGLSGVVKARPTADELRMRLMGLGVYTIDSRGADVPDRFSFSLESGVRSPAEASGAGPDQAPEEGGGP